MQQRLKVLFLSINRARKQNVMYLLAWNHDMRREFYKIYGSNADDRLNMFLTYSNPFMGACHKGDVAVIRRMNAKRFVFGRLGENPGFLSEHAERSAATLKCDWKRILCHRIGFDAAIRGKYIELCAWFYSHYPSSLELAILRVLVSPDVPESIKKWIFTLEEFKNPAFEKNPHLVSVACKYPFIINPWHLDVKSLFVACAYGYPTVVRHIIRQLGLGRRYVPADLRRAFDYAKDEKIGEVLYEKLKNDPDFWPKLTPWLYKMKK